MSYQTTNTRPATDSIDAIRRIVQIFVVNTLVRKAANGVVCRYLAASVRRVTVVRVRRLDIGNVESLETIQPGLRQTRRRGNGSGGRVMGRPI